MAEKKATTKATAKKATAKKPTTKKLSVTLDAETYALLEEYIAEFGFTKDGFVKKAILHLLFKVQGLLFGFRIFLSNFF